MFELLIKPLLFCHLKKNHCSNKPSGFYPLQDWGQIQFVTHGSFQREGAEETWGMPFLWSLY